LRFGRGSEDLVAANQVAEKLLSLVACVLGVGWLPRASWARRSGGMPCRSTTRLIALVAMAPSDETFIARDAGGV
jgi:hypothetical protein